LAIGIAVALDAVLTARETFLDALCEGNCVPESTVAGHASCFGSNRHVPAVNGKEELALSDITGGKGCTPTARSRLEISNGKQTPFSLLEHGNC